MTHRLYLLNVEQLPASYHISHMRVWFFNESLWEPSSYHQYHLIIYHTNKYHDEAAAPDAPINNHDDNLGKEVVQAMILKFFLNVIKNIQKNDEQGSVTNLKDNKEIGPAPRVVQASQTWMYIFEKNSNLERKVFCHFWQRNILLTSFDQIVVSETKQYTPMWTYIK